MFFVLWTSAVVKVVMDGVTTAWNEAGTRNCASCPPLGVRVVFVIEFVDIHHYRRNAGSGAGVFSNCDSASGLIQFKLSNSHFLGNIAEGKQNR